MIPAWLRGMWPAIAVVAVLQSAVLGWMVLDRRSLLTNGEEIVLPIVPVDPRSLFRGDYVILSYDISRIPGELVRDELTRGDELYVTIERQPDEPYKPVAVSKRYPGKVPSGQIVLQGWLQHGRVPRGRSPSTIAVRYGIESYFVQEDTGTALENTARERKLAAVVAVDGNGRAGIKGLVIDGKRVYDEPLF